jgi:tetratricopeptide (TPR) repeat protein
MNSQALQQLTQIASAAERAGDLPRAAAAYRELTAALPRNADLLHRLGLVEYMMGNHEDAIGPLSAAAIVVTLPVLIMTIALQRQIIAGLTAGGVKGG